MPFRAHLIAIFVIVALPLAFLLYDSHFTTITYTCGARQSFTLSPNTPGSIHGAEIRLEGAGHHGRVTIEGFPDAGAIPQVYEAGASAADVYEGEMYEPVVLAFEPDPGAKCDLRVTFRLSSDLSMLNPLW